MAEMSCVLYTVSHIAAKRQRRELGTLTILRALVTGRVAFVCESALRLQSDTFLYARIKFSMRSDFQVRQ